MEIDWALIASPPPGQRAAGLQLVHLATVSVSIGSSPILACSRRWSSPEHPGPPAPQRNSRGDARAAVIPTARDTDSRSRRRITSSRLRPAEPTRPRPAATPVAKYSTLLLRELSRRNPSILRGAARSRTCLGANSRSRSIIALHPEIRGPETSFTHPADGRPPCPELAGVRDGSPRSRESDRLARTHRWQARQLELAEADAQEARPTTQVLEPRHRDNGHLGRGVWPGVQAD